MVGLNIFMHHMLFKSFFINQLDNAVPCCKPYLFSAKLLFAVSAVQSASASIQSFQRLSYAANGRITGGQTAHTHGAHTRLRRQWLAVVGGRIGFVHVPAALPHYDTLNRGHRVLLEQVCMYAAPFPKQHWWIKPLSAWQSAEPGLIPGKEQRSDNKLHGLDVRGKGWGHSLHKTQRQFAAGVQWLTGVQARTHFHSSVYPAATGSVRCLACHFQCWPYAMNSTRNSLSPASLQESRVIAFIHRRAEWKVFFLNCINDRINQEVCWFFLPNV